MTRILACKSSVSAEHLATGKLPDNKLPSYKQPTTLLIFLSSIPDIGEDS